MVGSPPNCAPELRVVFRVELLGGGIDLGRVDVQQGRLRLRLGRGQRHVGGNPDFFVHLALDGLDLGLGGYAVRDEPFGKQGETIVAGLLFPLLGRLVQDLIVREGMRVGPGHVRVHQGGALTLAHVFRGP